MSTTVITPNNPQYSTTGPWWAWAGAWAAGSLTYGVDYTQSITLNNTTFPNGTLFSWSFPLYGGPFGVWSYPSIIYGSSPELINPTVPSTQVANFVNLSTSYSAALTVNSGQLDTIFDIWLTSKPNGDMTTAKYELEIIPQTFWHYSPLTYTFTDSTLQNANVYVNPKWGGNPWTNIVVAPSSEMLTGTISISDILKSLIWHGVLTGQEYISGIEFGPEPGSGSGSLLVNNLSYQWNGRSTIQGTPGNDTFQITAPGGNDVVGDGGVDTVIYNGLHSQFQIKTSGSETLVTRANNISTLDYLQGVTFIQFSDGMYNVPTSTFASTVANPTVTSVALGGPGIVNGTGDLNAGHVVTLTLTMSEAVNVAGGTPTLTLNDGGIATYVSGSAGAALTFNYTVAAGQNTPNLTVLGVNLNGATIADNAGNSAMFSGPLATSGTLQIDTTAPRIASSAFWGAGIVEGSGDLNAGKTVYINLNLTEVVTISGHMPFLSMNDGGMANYWSGSGTDALTFSYTVAAGQNTPDLAVAAVNLNGVIIADGAGNIANLTDIATGLSGTLQIDTTPPAAPVITHDTVNQNNTVSLSGTAEANSAIALYDGGSAVGQPEANASGQWSFTSAALAQGLHTFTATATDAAGNISALSATGQVTVTVNGTTIQTDGSTSLVEVGTNYFLHAAGGTSGPELKFNGSAVTVGEFANWSPIGAVQTASGYDVAWKMAGSDAYTVWSTDASGRYISNLIGATSGTIATLESFETIFNQDLNGDGVLGLNPHVIQTDTSSLGATSLATIGNNYFLYAAGSTTGPELQYNGSPVTTEWGGWSPIGAVKTANGYDVAWKLAGADDYTVWSADNNGNYLSNIVGVLSGASWSLESLETVFNQDLNADGVVGLKPHVVQTDTSSLGATSLATIGNNYFLYAAGSTTGPELQYNGSPVTTEWGGWSPIGAVKTANGYDVAWKLAGADDYTVWNADNNGNYLSNIVGVLSGASWSLESLETVFNQDLNADGVVGLKPHVVQTDTSSLGATSLATIGNNYFLYAAGSTTGPELQYNGSPVTTEWGGWSPIGAVKTANGYDVAWKLAGADDYTVWSADNNGNYLSNIVGVLSGASWSLESLETVFNQDLNADGVVGLKPHVVQTDTSSLGATSLATIGNNYFLYAAGSTTGPELQYNGSPVTTEWGGWSPIGAVKTANGYDVAWKLAGADDYTVWNADNNGNYLSNIVGVLSGASWSLESLETVFNQDLNADGVVGLKPHVVQTDTSSLGATSLATIGNNYFLYAAGSTTGPELQYNGSPVTTEWGGWSPIGAVKTANGYDVAWKLAGADDYTVWSADNNGNYLSNIVGVLSGASWSLESLETVFNQDLNADGVVGLKPHVVQTDTSSLGATSLATIGNNYFLYAAGSTTGPELQYNGSPVTTEWGGWSPIGAVKTANGYDVAWKLAGADDYTVWSADNNGNYLSNIVGVLSGASWSLESLETVFNQDLNADGVVGLKPHVVQTDTSSLGATSLATIGNNYFLYAAGGTTGPELQYNGSPVTTEWGGWSPIGAVKNANGYDVAWKLAGADDYTVWSTDASGHYISNLIGATSGTTAALESFETIFNQDLNGDGVVGLFVTPGGSLQITQALTAPSGTASIGAGAALELTVADSATVAFTASTGMLKLDQPSTFSGQIFGFTGGGTLSGSDQIDLKGINFGTVQGSYANGVLTVTDGAHGATLNFHGTYTLANFKFADDGNGGTIVYDPPVRGLPPAGQSANVSVDRSNDAFVFHPNLGLSSASELQAQTAPDRNEHPGFAATYSTVHDAHENIIGDFAHEAIASHSAALAQLHQAHLLV